ncbi:MAG: DUF6077 domain-containing protein [Clostridiales bacterium]|nr:DUF6077 domain-containing protein [Roseburia sp.]MDD7637313.1 DUF6077 domain-containing protein [Clostridiales bacterium]MDY4111542.1 DUF6077 domain-containing protein [Roseburia sp.]
MNSYMGVAIALIVLSIIFLLLGNQFLRLFHREDRLEFQWLFGFVLFLAIFAIVDLPVELMQTSFHALAYWEAAVFLILTVASAVWYVRNKSEGAKVVWKKPDMITVIFLVLIVVQVIYGMNNRVYASYYDTSYYNGHALNAIYTDTVYEYCPYTGLYVGDATEWNDSYPMLIAVLAKCFGMHTLVVINRVIGILEIVAVNLIIYEIAFRLSDARRTVAVWTVGIHAVMSLLCWELSELNEYFLWVRMAESKSMLANVYLPLVLLALIMIAQEIENKYNWCVLAIIVFAGVSMSLSGIFMITVMVGVGMLPILLYQRKLKNWGYAVLCMLPSVMMGAIRLLG